MVGSLLDADESKWKLMRKHKIYAKVPFSINLDFEVPWGVVNVHMCSLRNSSAHHHFAKMALWRWQNGLFSKF